MPQFPATYAHRDGRTRLVSGEADRVKATFEGFKPSNPSASAEAFDPSKRTVAEVQAYLDGGIDAQERTRVLQAEAAGKNRSALTAQ